MSAERLLIVHKNTVGLAHDARVLATALRTTFVRPLICCLVISPQLADDYSRPLNIRSELKALVPFDYMFLLERAHSNPPLLEVAKRIVYIPNIEWLNELDETAVQTGAIDMVMLKNKFSFDVFSTLPIAHMVKRIALTGWTSEDIAGPAFGLDEKDYNRFVHVRGISSHKQTGIVMETWARHPEFPPLTVVLRFPAGFELPQPLRYADNVFVHLRKMPAAELRQLQRVAGIHVSPSRCEGFGHSLNEARAAYGVLLTTDAPPMNELVTHGHNGLLIPVNPGRIGRVGRSLQFGITCEDLARQIDTLLSMSLPRRKEMGRLSRQTFLEGRASFYQRLACCREIL